MSDINIYCDESCHLKNDNESIAVLGAITCPKDKTREVSLKLKAIRKKHGINPNAEIKWGKVSQANVKFFEDVVNYFFDSNFLNFRVLVANEKSKLDHEAYRRDHDDWYYVMHYYLLRQMIDSTNQYGIYLDIKDTKSQEKTRTLHDYLCNSQYDFDRKIIKRIETVRSHDTPCLQIADLLIGAVSYCNRNKKENNGKLELIELIKSRSGKTLKQSTLLGDTKFNVFKWEPKSTGKNGGN